jgi:hypothetical protein
MKVSKAGKIWLGYHQIHSKKKYGSIPLVRQGTILFPIR